MTDFNAINKMMKSRHCALVSTQPNLIYKKGDVFILVIQIDKVDRQFIRKIIYITLLLFTKL